MYVAGIVVVLIAAMILFSIILNFFVPTLQFGSRIDLRMALEFLETVEFLKLVLTSVNTILLVYLLYNYVSVYLEIRSDFSLGLIVIASALLAHTISASPIVAEVFGFRGTGLGPFAVIPSIFTLIASLVLIHLSQQ